MTQKAWKGNGTTTSFHVYSDSGGCEATRWKGKTSVPVLFVDQFLEFHIISNLSPRWDQELNERIGVFRQWWSGQCWVMQELGLTPCSGSSPDQAEDGSWEGNTRPAGVWHSADTLTTHGSHIFCACNHHTQPWDTFPKGNLNPRGRFSWKPLGFNESILSHRKPLPLFKQEQHQQLLQAGHWFCLKATSCCLGISHLSAAPRVLD